VQNRISCSDTILNHFETSISLSEFAKFQRQKAGPVNVLLASLSIQNLPSGNYNLVVEARDRNNNEILVNKIFFQRHNPDIQMNLEDIESVDVTSTFAEKMTNLDSLRFYVLSVVPVANSLEKQFARNVVKTEDLDKMQKFLYNFWSTRNSDHPDAEWSRYKYEVLKVEEQYKTRIKHGYETDLGRVYLQYGPPNTVDYLNMSRALTHTLYGIFTGSVIRIIRDLFSIILIWSEQNISYFIQMPVAKSTIPTGKSIYTAEIHS